MLPEHSINVDSMDITYYQAGSNGKPVILLHGGGTDSATLSWRETIPALAEQYQVYAPNWPGYGGSQKLVGPYTLDRMVDVLHGLMDAWGLDRASLVGLSMGGGAAIGFTLAHPHRVDRLVLVDSYGIQKKAPSHRVSYLYIRFPFLMRLTWQSLRRDKGMTRAALRSIFANTEGITDDLVDELFEAVQDRSSEQSFYAFQTHEMLWNGVRTNYVNRLPEIQAPTLFIHGDMDRLVPLAEIQQAAASMPNARVKVMDKTGHWAPREHPALFNQWAAEFLAGETGEPTGPESGR